MGAPVIPIQSGAHGWRARRSSSPGGAPSGVRGRERGTDQPVRPPSSPTRRASATNRPFTTRRASRRTGLPHAPGFPTPVASRRAGPVALSSVERPAPVRALRIGTTGTKEGPALDRRVGGSASPAGRRLCRCPRCRAPGFPPCAGRLSARPGPERRVRRFWLARQRKRGRKCGRPSRSRDGRTARRGAAQPGAVRRRRGVRHRADHSTPVSASAHPPRRILGAGDAGLRIRRAGERRR